MQLCLHCSRSLRRNDIVLSMATVLPFQACSRSCEGRLLTSSCKSVRPSVRIYQRGCLWKNFREVSYWALLCKSVEKMQLWLKLACTFCEDLSIFLVVVGSNVCCAKIIRTHCCFSVVLSKKKIRMPCIVENDIRAPTIQKERFVAFSWQQWLPKEATMVL